MPAAPSQAYFGGASLVVGTPNSLLLYLLSSFVSVSLTAAVATTLPWRSWSWRIAAELFALVAVSSPPIPGMLRVDLPSGSLVQAMAVPGAS
jgi:hypothetical protein